MQNKTSKSLIFDVFDRFLGGKSVTHTFYDLTHMIEQCLSNLKKFQKSRFLSDVIKVSKMMIVTWCNPSFYLNPVQLTA